MKPDPILFAMANPVPEVMPEQGEDIAAAIATRIPYFRVRIPLTLPSISPHDVVGWSGDF